LNDVGDDPDQLPVMQHALQQTWREWDARRTPGEIDIEHYEAAGTMNDALHRHAQRVMSPSRRITAGLPSVSSGV
jgi:hypothetical protein